MRAILWFCAFVFALGVVVLAVCAGPVGHAVDRLMPDETGLAGLVGAAAVADEPGYTAVLMPAEHVLVVGNSLSS